MDEVTSGGSTEVSGDVGGGVDSSSSFDGGESLQNEMVGDFFHDDGVDAVVDLNGSTQYDSEGNPIRSMEEFKAFQAKTKPAQSPQSTAPMAKNGRVQPKAQSSSFDTLFDKNGSLDFDAVTDHATRFNQFNYQSNTQPKVDPAMQQQQDDAPIDPQEKMRADVEQFENGLKENLLAPIMEVYNETVAYYQQIGQDVPQAVYESFNKRYLDKEQLVNNLVNQKRDELKDNLHKEELTKRDFQELQGKSTENFTSVANEFFPKSSPTERYDRLRQLIFGYEDKAAGKFVRGYGADYVDHLFDMAHDGKQFKSEKEWSKAYQEWWTKHASNPANIKRIAQAAMDRYVSQSLPKFRDNYRSTWEKEQAEKNKLRNQNPHATRGGNAPQQDATMAQLNSYFSPVKRSM